MMTLKRVAKLLHAGVRGRYRDDAPAGVIGLYLAITAKNRGHWELRFQIGGRPRWMGMGSCRDFDLLQARARARTERQKLHDGIDPLTARRALQATQTTPAALTFTGAAKAYVIAHQGKWRSLKHAKQWTSSLAQFSVPLIGNLDVRAVDTACVLRVLEQNVAAHGRHHPAGTLWQARSVSADRLRNRIELVLAWATARGHRSGDNPAAWGKLKHILPAVKSQGAHHAAVPYARLPQLMAKLLEQEGVAAKALRFLILTAARTGEVLGATHGEIDTVGAMWTIPGPRMKGNREHKVMLAPQALEVLSSLPIEHGNPHLFLGARKMALGHAALTAALQRTGFGGTLHGMRAAFSTWAAEKTRHERNVVELCLAHTIGNAVERSYQRGELVEKRQRLMNAWGAYCTTAAIGDNIVTLSGSGRCA
jgi:integrase